MHEKVETTKRIIAPGRISQDYFREVWRHRELFYFLAWRDFIIRYKQTVIGIGWAIIKPLLTIAAFTFVFGKLAGLPSNGIPYPVLVFSGLLPWSLFSSTLNQSSDSIVSNTSIVTKVYFPRIIIPASSMIVILIDFFISFFLFIILLFIYGITPSWRLVIFPTFLILVLIFSLGCVLWLSALNVKYRDVRFLVPFLLQFGLYISPVGYASSIVPDKWRLVFSMNPMVGVIDGFRWSLLSNQTFYWPGIMISVLTITILFFSGIRYFKKIERSFADFI